MQLLRPLIRVVWPMNPQPPEPLLPAAADLVQALPDPALVVDVNGMVTLANAPAAEMLEIDPLGRHLSAAIRVPAVLEAVVAAVTGEGSTSVDYELRVPMPRSFRAHVSCLGAQKGALIVLRDLTREQQIERMRADFVANASHELRTPLAALSGFLETIQGAAK